MLVIAQISLLSQCVPKTGHNKGASRDGLRGPDKHLMELSEAYRGANTIVGSGQRRMFIDKSRSNCITPCDKT